MNDRHLSLLIAEMDLLMTKPIALMEQNPIKNYPQPLQRVRLVDHDQNIILLTYIIICSAQIIVEYYKSRWRSVLCRNYGSFDS